jgi:hypothetical protein
LNPDAILPGQLAQLLSLLQQLCCRRVSSAAAPNRRQRRKCSHGGLVSCGRYGPRFLGQRRPFSHVCGSSKSNGGLSGGIGLVVREAVLKQLAIRLCRVLP